MIIKFTIIFNMQANFEIFSILNLKNIKELFYILFLFFSKRSLIYIVRIK